ncbi:MAG: HYR domain-containing protein [Methanosarcinales archaeon]|nr:HYR domain-containing protein [Methanosarcinales archaeon]
MNIQKGITAMLFAVMVIATLAVSPALANADPITVDPNSSIESRTWNYVHWGHWETDDTSIAAPGNGTTYAAHIHRDNVTELDNSTTTYTATTATTPCEYQLAFDMTMDNWLIWGGISQSYAEMQFTVTSDTDYDISGSYTTDANQGEDFDVYLKDLGTDTFVFQHENTTGTLSGSNLTGTIPPGDYEFYVKAESKAEGPWTWTNYPSKYGPVSGGPDHGTGSVHLGLMAQADVTPPVITCPGDVTVEQETADGTAVPLTATATDICDADVSITSDAPAVFPLGTTTVTFTATDDSGNSASCSMTVTVVDTTPPDISVTVSPDTLWPPNHKMVDIVATVTVSDICDAAPVVVLTSVTSDEPDDAKGNGDGKTVDDIQAEIGTEDYEFQLRAERAGKGDGRTYTITYTVTDASGNSADASATVVVPHDRR